jgi:hypothetical protein
VKSSYVSAEQLNLKALSAWEMSVGPDHLSLLPYLLNRALIRKMNRKSEAAPFQARAAVIKARYGSNVISYTIDVSLLDATGKKQKQ